MRISYLLVFIFALVSISTAADNLGIALDFGSEWLKACVVNRKANSIGSYLDIAINEQSQRKTPSLIGFDQDGDPAFGEDGQALFYRTPGRSLPHLKRLIGHTLADEATEQYLKDFDFAKYKVSDNNGALQFDIEGGVSVDELTTMFYQKVAKLVLAHERSLQKDESTLPTDAIPIVLLVPEWYSHQQRLVMKQFAELANLKVLDVMDELTAAAVDFAVRKNPGTKLAFFGAGGFGSAASLIEIKRNDENGIELTVLKSASQSEVGGIRMDRLLADHLAAKFDAQNPGGESVNTSARAMSKLLREARDTKEKLSVSAFIDVVIEELFGGKDLSIRVTKEEFESLIAPLVEKINSPLQQVLAGVDDVNTVELFGGVVRIPAIQSHLKSLFDDKLTLGRHVDGDEGAVLGAGHYAGVLMGINGLASVTINNAAVSALSSTSTGLSDDRVQQIKQKLVSWEKKEEEKRLKAQKKHQFESFIYTVKQFVSEIPKAAAKQIASQKAALDEKLKSCEAFLEDSTSRTSVEEFSQQLELLQTEFDQFQAAAKSNPAAPKKKAAKDEDEEDNDYVAKAKAAARKAARQRAREQRKATANPQKAAEPEIKKPKRPVSHKDQKVPGNPKPVKSKPESRSRNQKSASAETPASSGADSEKRPPRPSSKSHDEL